MLPEDFTVDAQRIKYFQSCYATLAAYGTGSPYRTRVRLPRLPNHENSCRDAIYNKC